jgi:hypothetical protein
MKETDDIDISVNIAGQPLVVTVPFSRQDSVREVEAHIESLLRRWKKEYPNKSEYELMAMLTYQYASYYFAMRERQHNTMGFLEKLNSRLDVLLKDNDAAVKQ